MRSVLTSTARTLNSPVDGDAHHMSCTGSPAGRTPVSSVEIVVLGVGHVRIDVEQAVVAAIAFVGDAAQVQALARDVRWW